MAKPLQLKDSVIDKLDTAFYVEQPNSYENKVNRNKIVKSTWDTLTLTVTGRADTQSAEKAYLNKEFTPKVKSIVTSVDEEFANIIKIRNIK